MKTSFALIVAATSVFVFTQAADAQCECQQTVSYYAPVRRLPTTLRPLPTTLRRPTTLRPLYYAPHALPTTLRPLPTIQLRRITPQPRHITGAVVITAVVITAATIAADCSAPAWAAGPVFVESTEGGIVAGGKRRGCRRSRSSWNQAKGHFLFAESGNETMNSLNEVEHLPTANSLHQKSCRRV